MTAPRKTIISCAITGAIHVPAQTPHLPLTPDEIAEQAIGAAEAGAAILHLHARDPETGHPSGDPEIFAEFLPEIRASTDAVINITTGEALGTSLEERAAAVGFSPELCSMNMGSMNFGTFPMAATISEFKNEWETGYLEMTKDFIFRNTFADIESWLRCSAPTAPASSDGLIHMKRTAGRHQVRLTTTAALMGATVRVGLEDSIYLRKGVLAKSNAQQVERTVRILDELSLEPATADEARQMLDLKGAGTTSL